MLTERLYQPSMMIKPTARKTSAMCITALAEYKVSVKAKQQPQTPWVNTNMTHRVKESPKPSVMAMVVQKSPISYTMTRVWA